MPTTATTRNGTMSLTRPTTTSLVNGAMMKTGDMKTELNKDSTGTAR